MLLTIKKIDEPEQSFFRFSGKCKVDMCADRLEFSGVNLREFRKWLHGQIPFSKQGDMVVLRFADLSDRKRLLEFAGASSVELVYSSGGPVRKDSVVAVSTYPWWISQANEFIADIKTAGEWMGSIFEMQDFVPHEGLYKSTVTRDMYKKLRCVRVAVE